jgi:hypothetical protein
MKCLIVAAMMAVFLSATIADAKTERTHSGDSYHPASMHRVTHGRAAKPKRDYVVVNCKTKACMKKHPSGTYGFVPKKKA